MHNADGTDIDLNKVLVAPINQLLYSMISSVDLFINNQRITINQSNYPFMTYMLNLLLTNDEYRKKTLRCAGWLPDDAGLFDICPYLEFPKEENAASTIKKRAVDESSEPTPKPVKKVPKIHNYVNMGFKERKDLVSSKEGAALYGVLLFDSMLLPRVLPNQTDVSIILNRTEPSFYLQSKSTAGFKVSIVDAKLYVLRMKLNEQLISYHNKLLSSGGINYPAVRYDIRTLSLMSGSQNLDWTPFNGVLPKRIFFFQCLQSSYNGQLDKNAYNLQTFGLKTMQVLVNGRSLPWNQPLTASKYSMNAFYYATAESVEYPPYMTNFEFKEGFFVVALDLSKTLSANCDYNDPIANGNVRIIINYKKPLKDSIIVFSVGEYNKLLHLDEDRNPTWI